MVVRAWKCEEFGPLFFSSNRGHVMWDVCLPCREPRCQLAFFPNPPPGSLYRREVVEQMTSKMAVAVATRVQGVVRSAFTSARSRAHTAHVCGNAWYDSPTRRLFFGQLFLDIGRKISDPTLTTVGILTTPYTHPSGSQEWRGVVMPMFA